MGRHLLVSTCFLHLSILSLSFLERGGPFRRPHYTRSRLSPVLYLALPVCVSFLLSSRWPPGSIALLLPQNDFQFIPDRVSFLFLVLSALSFLLSLLFPFSFTSASRSRTHPLVILIPS
ncbi:hypothetical protein K438DRAFT_1802025 [Mycena galopus ATCC 62051]|nr:hypothetical protein K438DRAFT_1802025 [Mycena galopus ATCC 62051]